MPGSRSGELVGETRREQQPLPLCGPIPIRQGEKSREGESCFRRRNCREVAPESPTQPPSLGFLPDFSNHYCNANVGWWSPMDGLVVIHGWLLVHRGSWFRRRRNFVVMRRDAITWYRSLATAASVILPLDENVQATCVCCSNLCRIQTPIIA